MTSVIIELDIPVDQFERAIKAKDEEIRQANRRASDQLGKRGMQLFKGTTRNFRHRPEFTAVTSESGDNIELLVGTDDKIYGYLDKGTSVRFALMSPDFAPKTTPGSLRSNAGQGGVVIVNRNNPRPGIRARGFSTRIEEILRREAEPTFNAELKKVK